MPAKSSTVAPAASTATPAVAAAAAAASSSAAPKAARKGKSATAEQVAAPAPVVAAAVATPAVAVVDAAPTNAVVEGGAVAAPAETGPTLADLFNDLSSQLVTLRKQLTTVTTQFAALRTRTERDLKQAQKRSRKQSTGVKKESGFVKPAPISVELAAFLGKPKGTEMARTEVTKALNTYIRENNLKDPENGRIINADDRLRKLLRLGAADELTFFNIQRYLSPHFPKAAASGAGAAAAAPATKA